MRRRTLLSALPPVLFGLAACTPTPPAAPSPSAVVFFTADSAALDDQASTVIRTAAADAAGKPSARVYVMGFAAPDTGTVAFNRALAEARAQAVADGLVTAGVPRGRVVIQSRGAVPYTAMPTEARRVEIVVGP